MERIHNFNPGPAALPLEVLRQAQRQLIDYRHGGMSIMEMSHRSSDVERLFEETGQLLLKLLGLDASYTVLTMGGGASMQFAMLPLNAMESGKAGGYVVSGSFSEKAYQEARFVGDATVLASSKNANWRTLPAVDDLPLGPAMAYVHMTTNNTIEGSQFRHFPDTGAVPLIGDMTSDMLSRVIDYRRFAMCYASAQKNLGPAGVTVAVVRKDLLDVFAKVRQLPSILRYSTYAQHKSMYNTPPVHAVYMMKLVLEWTERQGGIAAIEQENRRKAELIYGVIDQSDGFYDGLIAKSDRSMMNMTWRMADEAMEKRFVLESEANGFDGLAGHRSVGGIRASAYNAVPYTACKALAEFMLDFRQRNG